MALEATDKKRQSPLFVYLRSSYVDFYLAMAYLDVGSGRLSVVPNPDHHDRIQSLRSKGWKRKCSFLLDVDLFLYRQWDCVIVVA